MCCAGTGLKGRRGHAGAPPRQVLPGPRVALGANDPGGAANGAPGPDPPANDVAASHGYALLQYAIEDAMYRMIFEPFERALINP